jgi:pimeloyl-ACP methyl ester carboxylesterase
MATFVLVHGGYHGGWCWDRLVPHLERAGHACVAPDLPIDDAAAGYEEYAEAVLQAMSAAGVGSASDVVLVGHSLGCYITPMVAARTPARHVVSLCAVPADPGQPLDLDAGSILTTDLMNVVYFADEMGRTLQSADSYVRLFYSDVLEADAAWALRRLRPQGSRPMTDAWPLTGWPDVPHTVVLARDDNVVRLSAAEPAARACTGREPIIVPGGHSVFLTDPAGLADILIDLIA